MSASQKRKRTPPPQQPPAKKQRNLCKLTPEQEQVLIDFIQAHPCLYKKSDNQYSNKEKRNAAWEAQAKVWQYCDIYTYINNF
jgi:hypothetical protein